MSSSADFHSMFRVAFSGRAAIRRQPRPCLRRFRRSALHSRQFEMRCLPERAPSVFDGPAARRRRQLFASASFRQRFQRRCAAPIRQPDACPAVFSPAHASSRPPSSSRFLQVARFASSDACRAAASRYYAIIHSFRAFVFEIFLRR